jgi:hypothetical protein
LCRWFKSSDVNVSRILILGSRFIGFDVCPESIGICCIFYCPIETIGIYIRVGSFPVSIRILVLSPVLLVSIPIIDFVPEFVGLGRLIVLVGGSVVVG